MSGRCFFSIQEPFIHSPKVRGIEVDIQVVHQPSYERELFRWTDWTTDANGVVGRGLFPGSDVFECFSEVKIFERVVHHDLESGSRELEQLLVSQFGSIADDIIV